MADKRISQLIERTDIANNDVLPIVASGATTTNKVTVSTLQDWMQENLDVGVTSVGLSMPSAFTVSNSPVTTSGNISVSGAGTVSQYIRGDGSLADFPSISGGGSSVSYYLNGSVSQGTIGGIGYYEMNKVPILGTGTDFVAIADGYLASFITDAGDPSLLEIPGGNWNFETYFSASSGGGTPSFYIELYKVNSGGTATLIASNSGTPELIAFGTTITPYFSTLAVPTTTLALTDRLALRYYVARSGRTITLHTENSHLCQIITTFTTGLTALNGLTAQVQNLATGTSGSDFNIVSSGTTHTFNLPDASASNRGVVTTGTQTFAGYKIFNGTIGANVDIQLATVGTALNTFIKNINGTGLTSIGSNGFGFNNANNIYFSGSNKGGGVFAFSNSGTQTYTLQNASGTLAFTSDLGGYLPLTGGTLTGALNGTSAIFSGDVQSGTRLIAAASSQSIILTPNSGGTTNRVESVGTLPLALVSGASITLAAGGTTPQITLATTGAVTFSNNIQAKKGTFGTTGISTPSLLVSDNDQSNVRLRLQNTTSGNAWDLIGGLNAANNSDFSIYDVANNNTVLRIVPNTGAATFSSSVTSVGLRSIDAANTWSFSTGSNASTPNIVALGTISGTPSIQGFNFGFSTNQNLCLQPQSGNVGIGTTSPSDRLVVEGSDVNLAVKSTSNVSVFKLINTSGTSAMYQVGNTLFFDHLGLTPLRIASTGAATFSSSVIARNFESFRNDGGIGLQVNGGDLGAGTYIASFSDFSNNPRVVITGNGRVGIGTASPTRLLHITQSASAFTEVLRIENNSNSASNDFAFISLLGSNAANTNSYHYIAVTGAADRLYIYGNGNVVNTNNSYGALSDIKIKENVVNASDKLDDLMKVKVRNFNYIGDDKKQIGVIAQELEEVFPSMIDESEDFEEVEVPQLDEEGNEVVNDEGELVMTKERVSKGTTTKSVKYSVFVPMLIKAIQEQQEQINSLKNQINQL